MIRVPSFRFEKESHISQHKEPRFEGEYTARRPEWAKAEEIPPTGAPARLTRRVIFIHQTINEYRESGALNFSGEAGIFSNLMCLHLSNRNKATEEENGTGEEIRNSFPSETSISRLSSGSASASNGKPVKMIRLHDLAVA